MMDIKSPDVVFLGSTFEESVPASSTDAPARPGARAGDVRTPDPELGVHEKGSFHGVNFPFLRQALKRSVCSAISSSRTPSSK